MSQSPLSLEGIPHVKDEKYSIHRTRGQLEDLHRTHTVQDFLGRESATMALGDLGPATVPAL